MTPKLCSSTLLYLGLSLAPALGMELERRGDRTDRQTAPGSVEIRRSESGTGDTHLAPPMELERQPQDPLPEQVPPAQIPPAPVSGPPGPRRAGPDEGVLWKLYRERRHAELDRAIRRTAARHPGWSPPRKLARLLAAARERQQWQALARHRNWNGMIQRAEAGERPGCSRIDHAWLLAEAYARTGQPGRALAEYGRLLDCPDSHLQSATLEKAAALLPSDTAEALWADAGPALGLEARTTLDEVRYRTRKAAFVRAYRQNDAPAARTWATRLGPTIVARSDATMAGLLGWHQFRLHHWPEAANWFEMACRWQPGHGDCLNGQMLSLLRAGKVEQAKALARLHPDQEKLRRFLGETALAEAWQAYAAGNYAESAELLEQAQDHHADREGTESLGAWLSYRRGDYAGAAERFGKLYQAHPTEASAQGHILGLAAIDRARIAELAAQDKGPLGDAARDDQRQFLYRRKQFLAAHEMARERDPALQNIDSEWLAAGTLFRHKSGESGLGRLDIWHRPMVEGGFRDGSNRLELRISELALDSGSPRDCAAAGSLPVNLACPGQGAALGISRQRIDADTSAGYRHAPTHRLSNGQVIEITYAHEGQSMPYLQAGMTPTDGVVDPLPTFRAGLLRQETRGHWFAEAYGQPVRQSILSYTGLKDPYTNRAWGRVLDTGMTTGGVYKLGERWTVSGTLNLAWLTGQRVRTNWTTGVVAGLGYDFQVPGFDYFALGPYFNYQHFDRNLSHFTVGHGGYFSPDRYTNLGLGLNFLTEEGRSFVVQGRLAAGWQDWQADQAPWFPNGDYGLASRVQIALNGNTLYTTSPFYAAQSRSGIGFDVELKGVWLVHPQLELAGGVAARGTNGYEDYTGGLFVRFLFEPRRAAYSSDIPDTLFRAMY